jgi:tRNA G18 (ribose-2'-O)-methylase SpoU
MAAGVESLNAAAAATLLFYEWRRRGFSGRVTGTG